MVEAEFIPETLRRVAIIITNSHLGQFTFANWYVGWKWEKPENAKEAHMDTVNVRIFTKAFIFVQGHRSYEMEKLPT